jgi:arylsulfatase A-like enzyme
LEPGSNFSLQLHSSVQPRRIQIRRGFFYRQMKSVRDNFQVFEELLVRKAVPGRPAMNYRKSPATLWTVLLLAELLSMGPLLQAQTAGRPNLLLVSIDTLRADHLGCYGYKKIKTPNIDQLAADAVRFKSAVSQVPLTLPSHCTILTGTYPSYHGVRDNVGFKLPEAKTTLAEILKAQGYQTAAFIGAYVLNSTFGLNQGFDLYDDRIAGSPRSGTVVNLNSVERPAGEVIERAINWLRARRSTPFFMFVHLYDPHDPYSPPGAFAEIYKDKPYDGEIAYVDQEVGKLLAFLKDQKLYQNTIVVLTSDHGESFGEHGEWTHGYFIYDTTLLVPLIIKPIERGLAGKIVTEQVSLVDLVPTALQLLAVRNTADLQGQSLFGLMHGNHRNGPGLAYAETYYPAQFGWSPLMGIRREDYKFIRAPKPELYDLKSDPGEQANQIDQQKAVAAELKTGLGRIESTFTDRGADRKSQLNLSSSQLDALRSLGYVGASASPNSGSGASADG